MTVSLRYPAGSILPHGAYYLLQGQLATMKLRSWDDSAVFSLMGGENIADYYATPENVYVKDLKGLVPPWKQIDQKGATQDGRSFITSLYDPAEVEITAVIKGKTPATVRRTRRDLVAAIDAIETSELSLFTFDIGRWWSPLRWMATPQDAEGGTRTLRQLISLRLRAYDSFWRSYDVVDQFRIGHTDSPGDFSTDAAAMDSTAWTVATAGAGSGTLTVADGQVVPTLANGHSAVARRVGWTATAPVVELQLGCFPQWYFDSTTAFDFWVLPATGTPGTDGYRVRVNNKTVQLHQFTSGTGTLLSTQPLAFPPRAGEWWTFVGGPTFKLLRSGALAFSFAPASATAYTSAAFGLYASGTVPPPNVRAVSFGSDAPADQSGFVKFVNWGDQPMPPRFTCVGPGTFYLGNGPSATEFVKFGPLLDGQQAQILTDARKRGVTDLTAGGVGTPSQQDQNIFAAGLADLLGFANLLGGLLQSLTGILGGGSTALPPQGSLYSLLQGRFSKDAYIPAKPVAGQPVGCHVPVRIEGGTSSSQIIAAGTPLRRLPY
jgi:hypothetical protein